TRAVQSGRTSREKVGRSSQLPNVARQASWYCFPWRGLHRRGNAGIVWVGHPGDYATFNSYQPRYATPHRERTKCTMSLSPQTYAKKWSLSPLSVMTTLKRRRLEGESSRAI